MLLAWVVNTRAFNRGNGVVVGRAGHGAGLQTTAMRGVFDGTSAVAVRRFDARIMVMAASQRDMQRNRATYGCGTARGSPISIC